MAIDTVSRRKSVQGYVGDFAILAPVPDGAIAQADRQQITGIYPGILAGVVATWTVTAAASDAWAAAAAGAGVWTPATVPGTTWT